MKLRNLLHTALQLNLFDFEPTSTPAPKTPNICKPAPIPPTSTDGLQKQKLRRIQTADQIIEYTLRRSTRRSIGFLIEDDGLRITAPRWVTIAEIEDAIRSKQRWIVRKLHERRQQLAQKQSPLEWQDGAPMPFLGKQLTLRVSDAGNRKAALDNASATLTISLPSNAPDGRLQKRVLNWLQDEAHRVFSERLPYYAERLGVTYRSFALSNATTQWGSCTAQGMIRLNWRLIHLPQYLIDYVIAHELSHLREMNHSPRFWATVQSVFPEYQEARKILRGHSPDTLPLRR